MSGSWWGCRGRPDLERRQSGAHPPRGERSPGGGRCRGIAPPTPLRRRSGRRADPRRGPGPGADGADDHLVLRDRGPGPRRAARGGDPRRALDLPRRPARPRRAVPAVADPLGGAAHRQVPRDRAGQRGRLRGVDHAPRRCLPGPGPGRSGGGDPRRRPADAGRDRARAADRAGLRFGAAGGPGDPARAPDLRVLRGLAVNLLLFAWPIQRAAALLPITQATRIFNDVLLAASTATRSGTRCSGRSPSRCSWRRRSPFGASWRPSADDRIGAQPGSGRAGRRDGRVGGRGLPHTAPSLPRQEPLRSLRGPTPSRRDAHETTQPHRVGSPLGSRACSSPAAAAAAAD